MLGIAVGIMVVDGTLLAIYTLCRGRTDAEEGKTITVDQPMSPMRLRGFGIGRKWSRQNVLVSRRSDHISIESLVDGTATLAERFVVFGINVFIVCFVLLFYGFGLLFLDESPLVIFLPLFVSVWAFNLFKDVYNDYRQARKNIAARDESKVMEESGSGHDHSASHERLP